MLIRWFDRRTVGVLAAIAALAGCDDGTAPEVAREPILFIDNPGSSQSRRTGCGEVSPRRPGQS